MNTPYETLMERLPAVARLLLGEHAATLDSATRGELHRHVERGDWVYADIDRVRELLPPRLREILE